MRVMAKKKRTPLERLEDWQALSETSDRALALKLDCSHSKISRIKRGLHPMPVKDQVALQEYIGASPADWAAYYSELAVKSVTAEKGSQKKSLVAGEAA